MTSATLLHKRWSSNAGRDLYTYCSLMLHLLTWNHVSVKERSDHIINSTGSFQTLSLGMMKIRQTSSKKVNKINVMPLGTYFPACNNYDWITLIWRSILDATFSKNIWELLKILCVIFVRGVYKMDVRLAPCYYIDGSIRKLDASVLQGPPILL